MDRRPPSTARRRRLLIGGAALLLLLTAPLLLAWLVGWNWLRGPIERRVEARTGHSLTIEGDLTLRPGWPPRLVAERVRLGNAGWAADPQMATAERLEARFWPQAALRGQWRLPSVQLHRPRLWLEWDAEGRFNWEALVGDEGRGDGASIDRLVVVDGLIRFRDPASDTDLTVAVEIGRDGLDHGSIPMAVAGDGRFRGRSATISGRVDSPLLLGREHGYRIDLEGRAGATRAEARGELSASDPLQRFDVDLALAGDDLGELARLLDLGLPNSPPYRSRGHLRRDGRQWQYLDMSSAVAGSEFSGNLSFDFRAERPRIHGDLHGHLPDQPMLAVGSGDDRDDADAADPGRLFPAGRHGIERLGRMDGTIEFAFEREAADQGAVQGLRGTLALEGGQGSIDPLTLQVGGGRIDGAFAFDGGEPPLAYRARGHLRGLELPQLFPRAAFARGSSGRIVGSFALAGRGDSIGAMLATADGEASLLMGQAQLVPAPAGKGDGIDLAAWFGFDAASGERMLIRCAYAEFAIENGEMSARSLVIDSDQTLIVGDGRIDLGQEAWALELVPRPKETSFTPLRSPLRVGGTLRAPKVGPDTGSLVARGAATAGLAAITPPAALLAMIAPGDVEDVDCSGIWRDVGDPTSTNG
jgi:AsmA family protein